MIPGMAPGPNGISPRWTLDTRSPAKADASSPPSDLNFPRSDKPVRSSAKWPLDAHPQAPAKRGTFLHINKKCLDQPRGRGAHIPDRDLPRGLGLAGTTEFARAVRAVCRPG